MSPRRAQATRNNVKVLRISTLKAAELGAAGPPCVPPPLEKNLTVCLEIKLLVEKNFFFKQWMTKRLQAICGASADVRFNLGWTWAINLSDKCTDHSSNQNFAWTAAASRALNPPPIPSWFQPTANAAGERAASGSAFPFWGLSPRRLHLSCWPRSRANELSLVAALQTEFRLRQSSPLTARRTESVQRRPARWPPRPTWPPRREKSCREDGGPQVSRQKSRMRDWGWGSLFVSIISSTIGPILPPSSPSEWGVKPNHHTHKLQNLGLTTFWRIGGRASDPSLFFFSVSKATMIASYRAWWRHSDGSDGASLSWTELTWSQSRASGPPRRSEGGVEMESKHTQK